MSQSLIQAITAPTFKDRLEKLKEQRPDVQTISHMLGPEKFLEWAHTIGVSQDEQLRSLAPAIAPLRLRQITASHSESLFLWTGLVDIMTFLGHYHRFALPKAIVRVLDFGCGGGRLSRFLGQVPSYSVHGSDINADHVLWCQANLDGVKTRQNGPNPPLGFEDNSMDFIYALSVFSHLTQQSMAEWLRDLARVADKGAILLLTTHGEFAADLVSRSKPHQEMFKLSEQQAMGIKTRLPKEDYIHVVYDAATNRLAKAGEDYGNCFISRRYVENNWPAFGFKLLEYLPGGMRGFQDIVLLKKI